MHFLRKIWLNDRASLELWNVLDNADLRREERSEASLLCKCVQRVGNDLQGH